MTLEDGNKPELTAGVNGTVAEAGSQRVQPDDLHDLLGSLPAAGSDEEDPLASLRDDPNYSALIKDLEYIASQARLLFAPAEEAPSDGLWDKIKDKMSLEHTEES